MGDGKVLVDVFCGTVVVSFYLVFTFVGGLLGVWFNFIFIGQLITIFG